MLKCHRNDVHKLVGRRGKYLLSSILRDCLQATHKCYNHVTQLWQGSHQVLDHVTNLSSYLVVTASYVHTSHKVWGKALFRTYQKSWLFAVPTPYIRLQKLIECSLITANCMSKNKCVVNDFLKTNGTTWFLRRLINFCSNRKRFMVQTALSLKGPSKRPRDVMGWNGQFSCFM